MSQKKKKSILFGRNLFSEFSLAAFFSHAFHELLRFQRAGANKS